MARVMTFHAGKEKLTGILDSLRRRLPELYGSIAGFRGVLVLEKPGVNHVLAVTLWDDQGGIEASEASARGFAQEISVATGVEVSHGTYNVLGSLGLPEGLVAPPDGPPSD